MTEFDFEKEFKPLKHLGASYFKDKLFTDDVPEATYKQNQIPFGLDKDGNVWNFDIRENCRILAIGQTRSGKTWGMRRFADILDLQGFPIVFLPDVKDEFRYGRKEIQLKYQKLLMKNEKPKKMNVVALRPTFFHGVDNGRLDDNNFWMTVVPSELERADFMTLMNTDDMSPNQQTAVELIYSRMIKRYEKGQKFNFSQIDELIDELGQLGFDQRQRMAMKMKFEPLKTSNFYLEGYEKDIIKMMQKGIHPIINMKGWDNFGKGAFRYPEVFVSIILRKVIDSARSNLFRRVWIFVDEASRFIPSDSNPSCKRHFTESVDVDTAHGVNYFFATQSITKLPEELVDQCRYIMVPHSATVNQLSDSIKRVGKVRNIQSAYNDALKIKKKLDKHEWLIIDRVNSSYSIVKPFAPLSYHYESN